MDKIKQFLTEYHVELAQIAVLIALIILLPWYASILAIVAGIAIGYVLAIFKDSHENYSTDYVDDENADGTR